jgi:polyphosphate kinase 2 (PPK2 family)
MSKYILDNLDMSRKLSKEDYGKVIDDYNLELLKISLRIRDEGLKAVFLFEGWDASGKSGAIKRIVEPMDPRGYSVHMIGAPNEVEKCHNYLWRFWLRMPPSGMLTIFDRTWYGRVLVERLEGFASEEEWRRAYEEINNFEKFLSDNGVILLKFFFHITKDEQKERFEKRMEDPLKKYKIKDEDWRNRKKWDEYVEAYDDMFTKCSTLHAPWHIIEGNDKDYARLKSMGIVLEKFGIEPPSNLA